jgi:Domain of unknown function (DUF4314)
MTTPAPWQPGDRVALVATDDPHTRLRPGDQGIVIRWDPAQGQLQIRWESGSTLSMLPGEGDQIRLLARTDDEDGTESEDSADPDDGEPAQDWRQDITDPGTGLSRLLSERCPTCILRPGDPMHLGPERTAAFIRQVLDAGSYVVCHETLTYGDFPDYGPAICRGFFDAYGTRTRDLLILQAGRRLTEVPPPLVAKAEELGRDSGKAAATWVFDGNTPSEAYQHVLRGIDEGDPAVLDAVEPPAIGPGAGYDQDDLARDLGLDPGDRALPRAMSAYADAFTGSFWREVERTAREHTS